ncbi:MAG TPA: DUF6491 family protein [Dokdonella sp.]
MRIVAAVLICAALARAAFADTAETERKNLESYLRYAGPPIDEFRYWSFYDWKPVGADKVAVWTTINDAYLLTVGEPCDGLEWAKHIGVTSQARHVVGTRFDYVTFDRERCRIERIEPIDYRRMKADRVAE